MNFEHDIYALDQVSKNFVRGKQKVPVFDSLSLKVPRGDFVSLMGPSGSGKTTLLNLLGGLDRPSGGTITYKGIRLDGLGQSALSAWRRENVGFVFQSYNLMPTLSAAQNVALPLLLTKLSAKQRQAHVQTALDLVNLTDRARHKPRELSGGQQQRVAIARAIVADPEIILADEPTGDLDRENASHIMELFQTLNSQLGKTIVMVTHDTAAARYAKRAIHFDKGVLAQDVRQ